MKDRGNFRDADGIDITGGALFQKQRLDKIKPLVESQFGDATGGQIQHSRIVAGIGEAGSGWIHR